MKKIISLVLVLAICLSFCACGKSDACTCDCPQCALCEQKAHSHETVNVSMDALGTTVEQDHNGNKIVFPEPVLLAEDNKVRIELVSFVQEESPWKDIGKYVSLKFTNYADYEIGVRLENLAVNNESADASYRESPNILPGETTTYFIEIRDAFNHALDSLDQLYALKGRFEVLRRTGTNSYTNAYEIPFSIPDALNNRSDGTSSISETASIYYGKWQVTEVKIAGENASDEKDETIDEVLKGILDVLDDTYFVFAESGNCCYYTGNGTTLGKWNVTETGVTAGTNVWVAEGNQLVCERDGFVLYWEKVSDSQAFPET